jgi:hypothetical protein
LADLRPSPINPRFALLDIATQPPGIGAYAAATVQPSRSVRAASSSLGTRQPCATSQFVRLYDDHMTRRTGRHPDPVRVVAAMVGAVAERCVIGQRITDGEALAEIAECLTQLPREKRTDALTRAAAGYVDDDRHRSDDVLALLVRAGADLETAQAMRAADPRRCFQVGGR